MIVRAVSVLVLLALYHAAGVHGFAAFLLEEGPVYTFDRLVQSSIAVVLFLLTLRPDRTKYVHREELRGIWEAIEEFDRDLRTVRREGGSYTRACHAGIGRVRSAVYRLAWILRGSPLPETMDARESCRRVWPSEDQEGGQP